MLGWNIFPWVTVATVALAVVASVVALCNRRVGALVTSSLAVVVLSAFVAVLWLSLERPPMRTMGETRLWYSLFLLVAGVATYARWRFKWVLSFSTMMATVFMVINCLRPELHDKGLMPALQSAWFMPHVAVYMFSYALLGVATLLSLYYLVKRNDTILPAIDNLLGGGLALFTVGMLTGALWAKQAWGEYWSWDAKEAWAAATWFIYLGAIHLRLLRPKATRAFCLLLIVGFLSLQMCWYGVNYLPSAAKSVHSYNQ
ncbi:MAG: cytochrome c biogenesis protein CcsA [Alistipes sp.]|nr:cytochrome c biogenesis protein CcsA [Alistipes sp.]